MRSTLVLVLSLFVGLVPAAPVRGAGIPPEPPLLGVVVTEDGVQRSAPVHERVLEALGDGDAEALGDALQELAGGSSVSEGFDGHAGVFLQGDATGDGLSESLVVQLTGGRETPALLVRVMTPPGHVLWSRTIQGDSFDWTADADLDGDGLTDILWRTATRSGDLTTWRLFATRGSDGTTMWERTVLAAGTGTGAGAAGYDVAAAAGVSLAVVPVVGPDADGDGGADVWLNELDLASASVGESGSFDRTTAGVTLNRFSLLSGSSGTPISSALFPAAGSAFGLPIGDLSGDGRPDVLATQISSVGPVEGQVLRASSVTAVDGATGAALWTNAYPAAGAVGVPASDLTGDGLADVLVPQAGDPSLLTAVSGSDGTHLWEVADPLFGVVVPGNIDGEAGDDVLFLDADFDTTTRESVVHTLAVRGEDGTLIYETFPLSVALPDGGFTSIGFAVLNGDMDGDGTLDTVLSSQSGLIGETGSGAVHLLPAAHGLLAWSHPGTGILGGGAGDLDSDGLDDVLRYRTNASEGLWEYAALDGETGDLRWVRDFDGASLVRARLGEDLGGSGADDVLFGVTTETEDPGVPLGTASVIISTRVDAVDGVDGTLLWSGPAPIPL